MSWRQLVRKMGIRETAIWLGVTYPAVWKYVHGAAIPSPRRVDALLVLAAKSLSGDEYMLFRKSLAHDLGIRDERPRGQTI